MVRTMKDRMEIDPLLVLGGCPKSLPDFFECGEIMYSRFLAKRKQPT